MGEKIYHWGCISSVSSDNLTPYIQTTDNNQLIEFISDGVQRTINSLTIWAESSDLYINVNDGGECLYIPSNSFTSIDYLRITKIRVMANAGIKLRYFASYY